MLTLTEAGLYCPRGDFWIDPRRGVRTALITHAHSDHLRRGSQRYLCSTTSVPLVRARVAARAEIAGVAYGRAVEFGPVQVSFHSAGHVLGSAQIRLECEGEIWVVTGDFKRQADPSCEPFEVVRCDTLITESTFADPTYRWPPPAEVVRDISDWWDDNRRRGRNSLVLCYALGKTQRVLAELGAIAGGRPLFLHGEAVALTRAYRAAGRALPDAADLDEVKDPVEGGLVIAGHSILRSGWIERLGFPETAHVSGWALSRGGRRHFGGTGFVLSDHADWPALLLSVRQSGARRVLVDGDGAALVKALRHEGVSAALLTAEALSAGRLPVQGELFASIAEPPVSG